MTSPFLAFGHAPGDSARREERLPHMSLFMTCLYTKHVLIGTTDLGAFPRSVRFSSVVRMKRCLKQRREEYPPARNRPCRVTGTNLNRTKQHLEYALF